VWDLDDGAHLLTHTSGLTYGMLFGRPDGDAMGPAHAPLHWSPRKAADFAAVPLCFQPGTRFRYSYGTALLGLVLEAVTSKPLATILQDEVFAPLQMDGTGFSLSDAGLSQLATPYLDTTTRSVGAPVPALLGTVRECFIERDPGVASMSAATLTSAAQLWGRGKSRPAGDQGLYSTPPDWAARRGAAAARDVRCLPRRRHARPRHRHWLQHTLFGPGPRRGAAGPGPGPGERGGAAAAPER
jgi:CubicO group peptidase (beta-lactamase class C family)